MVQEFVATLSIEFQKNANPIIATEQEAYMRNQFAFYGLRSPERRTLQKPFLEQQFLPSKDEAKAIVKLLWQKAERDYQLVGQELMHCYTKNFEEDDMAIFEFMVMHKSWWDTIDFIATKLMGSYFIKYPKKRKPYVKKWLASNNIWLQRSALLFQLKYKTDTDTQLLAATIEQLLGSKEFFINKAIGWVLREYSRVNPKWVVAFVNRTALHSLSKREALRLL